MTDVLVTLPKNFGLKAWIEEGDAAGDRPSAFLLLEGGLYEWSVPTKPDARPGDRVYVVFNGTLIGYAPLHHVEERVLRHNGRLKPRYFLMRGGGAVAVTIDEEIPGFRGYRYRFWDREQERAFPEWKELAA